MRDPEELIPTDEAPVASAEAAPTERSTEPIAVGSITDAAPEASEADVLDQARPVGDADDEEGWPR